MNLLKMGEEELNESLRKFYAAARAKIGLPTRNSTNGHLSAS